MQLLAFHAGLSVLSRLGQLRAWNPPADATLVRNVAYHPDGARAHRLDIWQPRGVTTPMPVVFYVHGGGFTMLSKDSHWMMAQEFARRGYMVVNINYRLAPRHPFPAALQDVCAAYVWLAEHGQEYGADLQKVILAGESAGANLITALTLALCSERSEPYAVAARQTQVMPRAVLPACGILQVSDPERFMRQGRVRPFVAKRIAAVHAAYLGAYTPTLSRELELADPLLTLEQQFVATRPLPPFLVACGTSDPLVDDTKRLKAALDRLGASCTTRYYIGGIHAFHALIWQPLAKAMWNDTAVFLRELLEPA